MKDYRALASDGLRSAATPREAIPEAMRGFTRLGYFARREGVFSPETKQVMVLANAISQCCDDSVAYQARRPADLDASSDEVIERNAVALHGSGGPSMVIDGHALQSFDSFQVPTLP